MRSRQVLLLSLSVGVLWSGTGATAQALTVERIPGIVFGAYHHDAHGTTFNELFVYDAAPGETALVNCRGRGCSLPSVSRSVPMTGIVDFGAAMKGRRFHPGSRVEVRVRNGDDTKVVSYRIRHNADPVLTRTCTFPGSQLPTGCTVRCPPPQGAESYCAGAGQTIPLDPGNFRFVINRTKVLRLFVLRPSQEVMVAVYCLGDGCPFGARVYLVPAGAVRHVDAGLRQRRLRRGTVVELRVFRFNAIGTAFVIRFRGAHRDASIRRTCFYPTELKPRACPRS